MTEYNRSTHPTLRRGNKGAAVSRMQKRLAYHLDIEDEDFIDGDFGPSTTQQVKRFQKNCGLTADAVVGQNTWRALLKEKESGVKNKTGNTSSTTDKKIANDNTSQDLVIVDALKRAYSDKGYEFIDNNNSYELNIIGVRSSSVEINNFDDELLLIFRDESLQQKCYKFPITTDPGSKYTQTELLNPNGAAILQPGQYKNVYQIGKHRKKYDALVQLGGKVKVWRDANKDDRLDRSGNTYEGYYGINIHRAKSSGETSRVGPYSAGCQVFKRADDFYFMMEAAKRARQLHGNKFTYTLLEAGDF